MIPGREGDLNLKHATYRRIINNRCRRLVGHPRLAIAGSIAERDLNHPLGCNLFGNEYHHHRPPSVAFDFTSNRCGGPGPL
jgi:hypothetical protein